MDASMSKTAVFELV